MDANSPEQKKTGRGTLGPYFPVLLIGFIGLAVSLAAFAAVRESRLLELQAEFDRRTGQLVRIIQSPTAEDFMRDSLDAIENIRDSYRDSQGMDQLRFSQFEANTYVSDSMTAVVQWIPRVTQAERRAFEFASVLEGLSDFQIAEFDDQRRVVKASERDEYFPIAYVEPSKAGAMPLGFDLRTDDLTRTALRRAAASGLAMMTVRIPVNTDHSPDAEIRLIYPVYGDPETEDGTVGTRGPVRAFVSAFICLRRGARSGTASRASDAGSSSMASLQPDGNIDAIVAMIATDYHQSASGIEAILYEVRNPVMAALGLIDPGIGGDLDFSSLREEEAAMRSGLHSTAAFGLADRQWTLLSRPTPDFLATFPIWQPWAVLGAGLLLTFLVGGYAFTSQSRSLRIARMIAERTEELSEANEELGKEVTERKRAESELEKERDFISAVLDTAGSLVVVLDSQDRIIRFNRACERTTGYVLHEVSSKRLWDFLLVPEEVESVKNLLGEVRSGNATGQNEHYWITHNGRLRLIAWDHTTLRDESNGTVYVIATGIDITERKRAEETNIRLAAFPNLNPNPILEFGPAGDTIYFNPAVQGLVEELHLRATEDILPPDHEEILRSTLESGEDRLWVEVEVKERILSWDYHPIQDTGTVHLYCNDLTERRGVEAEKVKLEAQLVHAQKMEAIGTLAGGVAHDFNNLLTGILGYTDILKGSSQKDANVRRATEVIEKAAERAAQLTKQLLGFARRGKLQNTPVDIHSTIHEVVALLGRTIDKNITIERRLNADSPCVMGDPDQLQQVLLNLAVNARDAMPEGGELTFETENIDLNGENGRRFPEMPRQHYLILSVIDTGCGIPKDLQDRVFEPFFTSKEPGKGTGMGLAMVYGTVKNHDGSIRLYSEEGHGTRLQILLPVTAQRETVNTPNEQDAPIHGTGRVLVVDDEEVVRKLAEDMLKLLGYEVVTCNDGAEAVEYYSEFGGEIDLAIIDMIMPNLGGRDCFRELKRINPDIRAILSTGFGQDGAAQDILDEGMCGFAQKPYRLHQFSQVIAGALKA